MFMGKIDPGGRVLIVDDVVTYGATSYSDFNVKRTIKS